MDTQELIVGYVFGILEPAETQQVELLAAKDAAIRAEIQTLQAEIHRLALLATPVNPPPSLKRGLMERVAARPPTPARSLSRPAALLWAAVLALVLGLGGWNVSLRQQNSQLQAQKVELELALRNAQDSNKILAREAQMGDVAVAFLASSDTTSRALESTSAAPGAAGTMYMQPGNSDAVLVIDGLQPLPADKKYQFWLARSGQSPIPSDTFDVDANGHARLVIHASSQVNDYQQVMVTIEPTGGSTQPGGTTVLEGNL